MTKTKEQDAFDLSDEDFANMRDSIGDFEESTEEEFSDDTTEDSTISTEETEEEEIEDFSTEDFSADDEEEEEEEETDDTSGQDDSSQEDLIEIVHNGVKHSLPRNEVVKLAQQGFDYTKKTSALAPHRRLLQLIDDDQGLKDKINEHVSKKLGIKASAREDYESDEEWLEDNINKTVAKVSPFIEDTPAGAPNSGPGGQPAGQPNIIKVLQERDPKEFATVAPYLPVAAKQLSEEQYKAINEDPNAVIRFYDSVKKQVKVHLAKGSIDNPSNKGKSKKKTFNVRSGGTNNSKGRKTKKNVWDMSNKDFNAVLQKAKGY